MAVVNPVTVIEVRFLFCYHTKATSHLIIQPQLTHAISNWQSMVSLHINLSYISKHGLESELLCKYCIYFFLHMLQNLSMQDVSTYYCFIYINLYLNNVIYQSPTAGANASRTEAVVNN